MVVIAAAILRQVQCSVMCLFHPTARTQDMDVLWYSRVRGSRSDPEPRPWHQRWLLVTWGAYVWAAHRYALSLHVGLSLLVRPQNTAHSSMVMNFFVSVCASHHPQLNILSQKLTLNFPITPHSLLLL